MKRKAASSEGRRPKMEKHSSKNRPFFTLLMMEREGGSVVSKISMKKKRNRGVLKRCGHASFVGEGAGAKGGASSSRRKSLRVLTLYVGEKSLRIWGEWRAFFLIGTEGE